MFNNEPLISICIPNYNYEKFIEETIDSVLNQTYQNFEIIISDNCSTDSSVEIIKAYNDPRIKLYQNDRNISVYENGNKAMRYANGELIAVLHSDDTYTPNFLENIVQAYNKHPNHKVFITGTYLYHYEENKLLPFYPFDKERVINREEAFIRLMQKNNIGNGVNVVIHKDCLLETGGYSKDYRYAGDYHFFFKLAVKYDFVYINKLLNNYRIHKSNLSHTVNKNLDMFKEGFMIKKSALLDNFEILKDVDEDLDYIASKQVIYRCYDTGVKYKSGQLIRDMLNVSNVAYSSLNNDICYKIAYKLSYFINEKTSNYIIKWINYVFKLAFIPKKVIMDLKIEKLLKDKALTFPCIPENVESAF